MSNAPNIIKLNLPSSANFSKSFPAPQFPADDSDVIAAKKRIAEYDEELITLQTTIDRATSEIPILERELKNKKLLFNLSECSSDEIEQLKDKIDDFKASKEAATIELQEKKPSRAILEKRLADANERKANGKDAAVCAAYCNQYGISLQAIQKASEAVKALIPLFKGVTDIAHREGRAYPSVGSTENFFKELQVFFEKADRVHEKLKKEGYAASNNSLEE